MFEKAAYDILGVGAPFVDYIIEISEEELAKLPGEKGGMVIVDHKVLTSILSLAGTVPVPIPGGSGANTIRGLANFGNRCALIGKIGSDSAGKTFLDSLQRLNVTSLLLHSPTPSPQAVCLITPDGERTMRSFLGSCQEMTADDLDPHVFNGVKLVHIEGHSLFNGSLTRRAMELAKKAGAKVSFDLGSFEVVRIFKDTIIDLLSHYVDIVFANRDEILELTQMSPEKGCEVLRGYCETAIVLLGRDGCIIGYKERQVHCPAFPVDPIDTTGAGDLFASGFLHGYFQGLPLEECARYGAIVGAAVVQVRGVEIPPSGWAAIKQKIKT